MYYSLTRTKVGLRINNKRALVHEVHEVQYTALCTGANVYRYYTQCTMTKWPWRGG